MKLTLILCSRGNFVFPLSKSFLFSCLFLSSISDPGNQAGSKAQGKVRALSVSETAVAASSKSDKALYCTATLHTRTAQYHNTEIRHYMYFPNPNQPNPKQLNQPKVSNQLNVHVLNTTEVQRISISINEMKQHKLNICNWNNERQ